MKNGRKRMPANRMTLLTCVAGDSSQRWCVQAVQAS